MLGIIGGNGNHACPWCIADLKKPVDVNEKYKPRSHEDSIKIISDPSKNKKDFGYVNEPIIDFIDYDDIIIDVLHLLLRIGEKIFDSLIEKINQFEKKWYGELETRPVLNCFHNILSETCKIRKPFTINTLEDNKIEIKMRSLNGNDFLKIFQTLDENGAELSNFFSTKKKRRCD